MTDVREEIGKRYDRTPLVDPDDYESYESVKSDFITDILQIIKGHTFKILYNENKEIVKHHICDDALTAELDNLDQKG